MCWRRLSGKNSVSNNTKNVTAAGSCLFGRPTEYIDRDCWMFFQMFLSLSCRLSISQRSSFVSLIFFSSFLCLCFCIFLFSFVSLPTQQRGVLHLFFGISRLLFNELSRGQSSTLDVSLPLSLSSTFPRDSCPILSLLLLEERWL